MLNPPAEADQADRPRSSGGISERESVPPTLSRAGRRMSPVSVPLRPDVNERSPRTVSSEVRSMAFSSSVLTVIFPPTRTIVPAFRSAIWGCLIVILMLLQSARAGRCFQVFADNIIAPCHLSCASIRTCCEGFSSSGVSRRTFR